MAKRRSSKPTRTDLAEARAIVIRVFPTQVLIGGVFPKRPGRDGPALWVFQLIPQIAKALAKRSRTST